MTKKEETVLNAVRGIVERREEANCFPACALRRELDELLSGKIDRHELTHCLMQLVQSGHLSSRPTVNDQSYYLNNNDYECNS